MISSTRASALSHVVFKYGNGRWIRRFVTCKFDVILHNVYTLYRKNVEKNAPPESKLSTLLKSGRLHTYFQAQIALGLLKGPSDPPSSPPEQPISSENNSVFLSAIELQSTKRTNCQFGKNHASKSGFCQVKTVCHICKQQTCLSHMTYTCKKCL